MKKLYDELKRWGCSVDEALERVVDDDELYLDCLNSVVDDQAFYLLGDALRGGEVQAAFDSAHTLKGVLANLGLDPLFDITVRIVEPLRRGEKDGLMPIYAELMEGREKLSNILAANAK